MTSTFVAHHIQLLLSPAQNPPIAVSDATPRSPTHTKQTLHSVLVLLKSPLSPARVQDGVHTLASLDKEHGTVSTATTDEEEDQLKQAVLSKLVVGLYAEALDVYLAEASEVEAEAEWWGDIERSHKSVASYLLQTLPARFMNLVRTILSRLRANDLPLHPSIFTPSSIRSLFPPTNDLRPNTLTVSLFPHLRTNPHIFPRIDSSILSHIPASLTHPGSGFASVVKSTMSSVSTYIRLLISFFTLPFELTQQECRLKRKDLERIRDERAETLGVLTGMRDDLASALEEASWSQGSSEQLASFVNALQQATLGKSSLSTPPGSVFSAIQRFANTTIRSHTDSHALYLVTHQLHRPSRFTQIWPRILLFPPATVYLLYKISESRASLEEIGRDTRETVILFLRDWLFEPLKGVVKTVRAGGEEGMLISKEGVSADLDSLERMTLSLAQDKLHYGPEQLEQLSRQIRVGDLTPVLQIYEDDIKTPIKSAATGTLLRSVFVQIQKAKVDIDQALSGIDKLLKSQELTFAFVGVAPAFAVVYMISSYAKNFWTSGNGNGRYGGEKRRTAVWLAMRRIERLLISQPNSRRRDFRLKRSPDDHSTTSSSNIPPLTSGLLLLSVARLRTFAEMYLPPRSRLREDFLQDVEDLEDPALGRTEKLRIVDRMWKSWGRELRWDTAAGERR